MRREGWERAIVCASGPSLAGMGSRVEARRVADGRKVIAVNDAVKELVHVDVVYANDRRWWEYHAGAIIEHWRAPTELWSSNSDSPQVDDHKESWARGFRLPIHLVDGAHGEGFCMSPGRIYYGNNSGFQGINLALQFGAIDVLLVGFDMKRGKNGEGHFFGEHPPELQPAIEPGSDHYRSFVADFDRAAAALPGGISIFNCNPDSALRCFPFAEL